MHDRKTFTFCECALADSLHAVGVHDEEEFEAHTRTMAFEGVLRAFCGRFEGVLREFLKAFVKAFVKAFLNAFLKAFLKAFLNAS